MWISDGIVEGSVVEHPRGVPRKKLPYDVLFCPIGHNRTFAEMTEGENNGLSHRGKAFEQLKKFVQSL